MYYGYYNPYYLAHYGTATSGRYPRGSGERPYQRTSRGIVGYIKKRRQTKEEAKRKEARTKALKEELQKRKEGEARKLNKEKLLKEGSATDVLKYQSEFSNQELASALERIRYREQLTSYSKKELAKNYEKLDKALATLKKGNDVVETLMRTSTNAQKVYKTINDYQEKVKKTA